MFLRYEGVTKNGEKVAGSFLGQKEELVFQLRQKGIFLTAIKEGKRKLKKGQYSLNQFVKDIEQINYLVSAGLQIDKALATLIKNTGKKSVLDFWDEVLRDLKGGKQFSASIKDVAKSNNLPLSEFYINIISVGEEVGNLNGALTKVTEHLQFRNSLIKEVKSALAYPMFLVATSIIALFAIGIFILPKFSSIFSPKEIQALPILSRIILGWGKILNQNLNLVLIGVFIVIAAIFVLFSFSESRNFFKSLFFRLPVFEKVALQVEFANLCASLGTMLMGGVDISRAIKLSQKVVLSRTLRNILEDTRQELKKGLKISEVWRQHQIFPEEIISLVIVGENSASLGDIFSKLGKRYLQDFKMNISRILALLEPVLIIFLGLFVGMIVVAIMLAVVSLNNVAG